MLYIIKLVTDNCTFEDFVEKCSLHGQINMPASNF